MTDAVKFRQEHFWEVQKEGTGYILICYDKTFSNWQEIKAKSLKELEKKFKALLKGVI